MRKRNEILKIVIRNIETIFKQKSFSGFHSGQTRERFQQIQRESNRSLIIFKQFKLQNHLKYRRILFRLYVSFKQGFNGRQIT